MVGYEIGLAAVFALLVLIALRVPIAVALLITSAVGTFLLRGSFTALHMLKTAPFEFVSHWSLSAIPMFLLMGAIAAHSGISSKLFRAAHLWLGHLPGGLAIATNWASAVFAAASGSSIATAAAMGRLAIPEMLRAGYSGSFASGVVASAGTLGALIPPSILFLLYGVFAEQSITRLLIAGVIPGLLTAVVYSVMIIVRAKLNPKIAPTARIQATRQEKLRSLGAVWPITLIILGIILCLYSGIVTATEAGAFGAALTAIVAFAQRGLTKKAVGDSVREAATTTANIFFISIGASLFASFLAMSGFTTWAGDLLFSQDMTQLKLVLIIAALYLILGMFLDPLGILLLTLPIIVPLLERSGADMIWFGVIAVKLIEIGLLTPPVGFNVYVVKSVSGDDISLAEIFRGSGWFLLAEVFIMGLLIAYPELSTWLPSKM